MMMARIPVFMPMVNHVGVKFSIIFRHTDI